LRVLARVPKASAEMVAATIRTIFAQPTAPLVREQVDSVAEILAPKFPAVAEMLHDAKADLVRVAARAGWDMGTSGLGSPSTYINWQSDRTPSVTFWTTGTPPLRATLRTLGARTNRYPSPSGFEDIPLPIGPRPRDGGPWLTGSRPD
jgi:hypothetical protein